MEHFTCEMCCSFKAFNGKRKGDFLPSIEGYEVIGECRLNPRRKEKTLYTFPLVYKNDWCSYYVHKATTTTIYKRKTNE